MVYRTPRPSICDSKYAVEGSKCWWGFQSRSFPSSVVQPRGPTWATRKWGTDLIAVVDEELLEPVDGERLEAEDVEEADERSHLDSRGDLREPKKRGRRFTRR
jgi:hypothetical protein